MSDVCYEWSLSLEVIPEAEELCARGAAYIDNLLRDIFQEEAFYPLALEHYQYEYERRFGPFGIFAFYGGVKLENGVLHGLETLHQAGDCCLSESDGRLRVDSLLGGGVLNFEFDCTSSFMIFGSTVKIQGHIEYLEILFDFSVDANTRKSGVLHKFGLRNCKGLRIDKLGPNPLNYFGSSLLNKLFYMFDDYVFKQLEEKVKNYLVERLPFYSFP